MTVWIINPYGSMPDESWRTYRSTMVANALIKRGHNVVQFISNFEHRSKSFRSVGHETRSFGEFYSIHIVPSTPYKDHISLDRVKYERNFAKNLKKIQNLPAPDVVVLAEPAICYYDILLGWIKQELKAKLIIDLIDIWPELFHLLLPKSIDYLARIMFSPLYLWRKRLYNRAEGLIAVSKDYQKIGLSIKHFDSKSTAVVYWSISEEELNKKQTNIYSTILQNLITKKENEELWCIYAGTLGENYDIKSIFKVGAKLKEKYTSNVFKLIIAGDGPLSEFCKLNSDESIVFVGRLSSDELALLFKNCDFALSTYKGRSTVAMPIKAFDYFAYGLPLINSLGRDLGYFIERYKTGINYIPESTEDLYDSICYLIDNKGDRIIMKKNSLALSKEFVEDKQYSKFVDVIENVKNGSSKP